MGESRRGRILVPKMLSFDAVRAILPQISPRHRRKLDCDAKLVPRPPIKSEGRPLGMRGAAPFRSHCSFWVVRAVPTAGPV
jgi:hypothetical protein